MNGGITQMVGDAISEELVCIIIIIIIKILKTKFFFFIIVSQIGQVIL